MRRAALIPLAVLLVAGCGGGSRENDLRPAAPITLTAAIHDDVVQVSPASVGAGMITIIVSNQSKQPQTVTMETDELGGNSGGNRASSKSIAPTTTGRLTIEAREGTYSVHVGDDGITGARVKVGPPRKSAQDEVLQP